MAEEQSSLRSAIDKIMGWPAGGEGSSGQGGQGGAGITGGPVSLAAPKPFSDIRSEISNVIAPAAPSPFEAQLAGLQAQNAALSAKLAPSQAAAPAVAAPVAVAAAAKPEMISRAALYELQKQKQIENYMTSRNQQIEALRATGLYKPSQLSFAEPDFSVARKPANWGGATSYMNTSMVANPYTGK